MLSLYRAWLGAESVRGASGAAARGAPAGAASGAGSFATGVSSSPVTIFYHLKRELDVERIEPNETPQRPSNTVLDIASCDGPVRFSRVLNVAWREPTPERQWPCRHRKTQTRTTIHYYPCKTCGCKFPSYYFVHKHRKRCHAEETANERNSPEPSTSSA